MQYVLACSGSNAIFELAGAQAAPLQFPREWPRPSWDPKTGLKSGEPCRIYSHGLFVEFCAFELECSQAPPHPANFWGSALTTDLPFSMESLSASGVYKHHKQAGLHLSFAMVKKALDRGGSPQDLSSSLRCSRHRLGASHSLQSAGWPRRRLRSIATEVLPATSLCRYRSTDIGCERTSFIAVGRRFRLYLAFSLATA